jgi:hypothetical protein
VAAGKGAAETNHNTSSAASAEDAQLALDKAVSTALLLACLVGFLQTCVYATGSKALVAGMGLAPSSPM